MFQAVFAGRRHDRLNRSASEWCRLGRRPICDGFPARDFKSIEGAIGGSGRDRILPQILTCSCSSCLLKPALHDPRPRPARPFHHGRADGQCRPFRTAAFIPLLSSFACAIPGIMATRSISDPNGPACHTIGAPLMNLFRALHGLPRSFIGAFIPPTQIGPRHRLQVWWLVGLYVLCIVRAMVLALYSGRRLPRTEQRLPDGNAEISLPRMKDVLIRPVGSAPGSSCAAPATIHLAATVRPVAAC